MRYLLCSSLTLLAAACVCSGEEKKMLRHPSQDTAWALTFEDDFDDGKLNESNWFPGYRLGRVEYYKRIGYPNAHTRGWQPNPPLAHYVIKDLLMAMFQIGGWVGEIGEDLPYPLDFEVDYVKVWKKR